MAPAAGRIVVAVSYSKAMSFPPSLNRSSFATAVLLLGVGLVLFLGFYRNQWNVVRDKKFKQFQIDSESLVIARLVESRQNGLLAQNGLLGWGDVDPLDLNQSDYAHQYDVFLSGGEFRSYSLYKSASGSQALLFGLLQELSPFSPAIDLRNYRALVALLLAGTMSLVLLWVHQEFGLLTTGFVAATTVASQWITLFGRNLFYFIWASFLPLALMALYLGAESRRRRLSSIGLATLAFGGLLFKCLVNGYDFIIPALAMPVIPCAYYAVRDRWDGRQLAMRAAVLAFSLLAAIGLSLGVLAAQLSTSEGGFLGGVASVFATFSRRTYADPALFPAYAASLEAKPWSVLWTYISEDTAIGLLNLRFLDVIGVFGVFSVLFTIFDSRKRLRAPDRAKAYALIAATWLAMLAAVSWFLIFKGQAYVHTHTNYLAWHMPFTLFGYAMCAFVVRTLGSSILSKADKTMSSLREAAH
jgi:hypothetical protein